MGAAWILSREGGLVQSPATPSSAGVRVGQLCMTDIAFRELANDFHGVLQRVAEGEEVVITVDGQPVAALQSLKRRPRWMNASDFVQRLALRQADPVLGAELGPLSPDTTDDLSL